MFTVFVYGTLKAGFWNHHLLADAVFLGPATTQRACYSMFCQGFPGVTFGGARKIGGEIYRICGDTLAALDRLEGHPDFYRREKAAFMGPAGDEFDAWIYMRDDRPRTDDSDFGPTIAETGDILVWTG